MAKESLSMHRYGHAALNSLCLAVGAILMKLRLVEKTQVTETGIATLPYLAFRTLIEVSEVVYLWVSPS
jgi:hypothetical protein